MLYLPRRHGPSRLLAVSAIFVFFSLCYLYLRDAAPLLCDGVQSAPDLHPGAATHRNQSKVAKVTVAANALNGGIIHRALESHDVQNRMHGYKHFIAKNQVVSELTEHDTRNRPKGAWTKPAYMMSVIVAELQKEEDERLEWILYGCTPFSPSSSRSDRNC